MERSSKLVIVVSYLLVPVIGIRAFEQFTLSDGYVPMAVAFTVLAVALLFAAIGYSTRLSSQKLLTITLSTVLYTYAQVALFFVTQPKV